jgi:hypothetical protein
MKESEVLKIEEPESESELLCTDSTAMIKRVGYMARVEDKRNTYKPLVGKNE